MQTIYLDISKKGIIPPINAKQNDAGRKFKVFLFDVGVPYNTDEEVNFSLWYAGESGDGNYDTVAEESAFYVEGNSVIVELSPQMLKNPGSGQMCLTMSDTDNRTIGLWNIPYEVEAMPGYPSDQKKPYYPRIVRTVNGVAPDENGNVNVEGGGGSGGGASVSIVDNLGSSDPNAALSARMGGVLKTKIEDDVSALNARLQPQINQRVKTVNGVAPDENGNVNVEGGSGGGIAVETDPNVPAWAKQPNKPTYTAEEVGALPSSTVIPTVPTKVSAFENDKGYLTEEDVENILAEKENEGEIRYLTPAFTQGAYMSASGTVVSNSNTYAYTEKISVTEGDLIEVIVASTSEGGKDKGLTFTAVTAFADGEVVKSLGVATAGTVSQYTVPATVTEIVVSAKFFETAYSNQRVKITPANYGEEEETASLKLLRNDYSFSLPKKFHLKNGDTAKIYLRNLTNPNYLVRLGSYTDSTTIRACEDTVQITGNAVANKPIQYAVYDNHFNPIEEGTMTLSIFGTVPASQKMLLIGDSFIATSGGYFGSCLRDLFTADGNTLTLVGTKGSSPKNHEGYSGKKYTDFANGFSGSPFGESGFNFSSYMSANGYSGLSSVYIQLGTNDVSATNPNQDLSGVIAAMKTIVNSIRSYSTSIKIYVGMTVMPNLDSVTFANTYNGTGFNWIMKQNMLRLNDLIIKEYGESSSVTLVANNCILDNTEDILDNVHPTNAGFAKMAKQLYYTMMS